MRRISIAAAVAVLALAAAPGNAGPLTQDECEVVAGSDVWKQLGTNVLENLLFAEGSLWVSDGTAGAVRRFAPDGTEGDGLTGIPSPGGLAQGPDGLIYAGWGNSIGNAMLRTGEAKVVRFDPLSPGQTMSVYAEGFNMPNGMTFGPADTLYISNDFDAGLVQIPRANPAGWSLLTDVWGTNGLVVDPAGENLYAAITFDQRSPIERIPLANPGAHTTAAQLSFGAVSLEPNLHTDGDPSAPLLGVKGLDDMTRDDDGTLYVTANGTGELLRVDPLTGDACKIVGGLGNPSSVRIAPEPGPFADNDLTTIDLYVTEFSGAIRRVIFLPG